MIKRVLTIGVGVAIGFVGARALSKGRDEAAIKAEESLRTTFSPQNIGRTVGATSASILAETTRSFFGQLREEVPAFRSVDNQDNRLRSRYDRTAEGEPPIRSTARTIHSERIVDKDTPKDH